MELIKKENHFQILSKSVKEVPTGTGYGLEIEGYASTKDKDRYGDVVEPTAFVKAMKEYALNPILLLQHDADKPIGKVLDFNIDKTGLYIKAIVSEDIDGVMNKLKNGILKGFSIGYRLKDFETKYEEDDKGNIIDTTNVIKDLELLEISLVSIPANPYALTKSLSDCFSSKNIEMTEEVKEEEKIEEEVIEEHPNEEVETQEICEEECDKEEIIEADENSEISNNENVEAENVDEKPTIENDETNIPQEKSFDLIRKEFNQTLESKDMEIKAYAMKVDVLQKKFDETQAILSNIVEALKGMHDTMDRAVISYKHCYEQPIVKDKSADAIESAIKLIKNI